MVLPLLQFFYNHFVVEHVVLVDKLSMNSLSLCKRCCVEEMQEEEGMEIKELLERGFKKEQCSLAKEDIETLNTIVFVKSCCSLLLIMLFATKCCNPIFYFPL